MKHFELNFDKQTNKGIIKISKCEEIRFYKYGTVYEVPILDLKFQNLNKLKQYFNTIN
jgi:hypothetical protein